MGRPKGSKNKKATIKKGLGDVVEQAIKATGLDKFVDGKDCGCDERKELLNKITVGRTKIECFTEDEYKTWGEFKDNRTLRISNDQRKMICKLFAKTFNKPYYEPCINCSQRPLLRMIEQLDKVYDVYE